MLEPAKNLRSWSTSLWGSYMMPILFFHTCNELAFLFCIAIEMHISLKMNHRGLVPRPLVFVVASRSYHLLHSTMENEH